MINEVLGGSLENITESKAEHFQERINLSMTETIHDIEVLEESKLFNILNKKILPVNSLHRQYMSSLGKGLVVSARSKDDHFIDGYESIIHPFLFGFQFHREKLWKTQPAWQSFFNAFANAVKLNV